MRTVVMGGLWLLMAVAGQAVPWGYPATVTTSHEGVSFMVDGAAGSLATLDACTQALDVLEQRGWQFQPALVRIEADPFDATAAAAEIVLPAGSPAEDNAFLMVETLLSRRLARTATAPVAGLLATTVAAHVTQPGAARRIQWEKDWLGRLAKGDVETTVLPELLWRTGGDQAIRDAGAGAWPEHAVAVLRQLGLDDPEDAAGQLALAGLLKPQLLGFHAAAATPESTARLADTSELWLTRPGLRAIALPLEAHAVAVEPLRCDGADAWVALKYSVTDSFDVVKLSEGREVPVPLQGAEWAAIVVVNLEADARLSLNARVLPDFPVQLKGSSFVARNGGVDLTWETERHVGLTAYVVEALTAAPDGALKVERSSLIPVADAGCSPFSYAFVDDDARGVVAYRLLALTNEGLLSEVQSFPVTTPAVVQP
jgi:hypothetical protein